MKKQLILWVLLISIIFTVSACGGSSSNSKTKAEENLTELENDTEIGDAKDSQEELSQAEIIYMNEKNREIPTCVDRAVQNYVVSSGRAMRGETLPSEINVIEGGYAYNSEIYAEWEKYGIIYKDGYVMPIDINYCYGFIIEDYLLDFKINDDYNADDETFSGRAYFQFRVTTDENKDYLQELEDCITVCIEFKMKYTEDKGYRVAEMKYLSEENVCHEDGE